tara:strand:+ start:12806 stop:13168 length:363 start_codon:yes stop_codon:yes gene_type:complete
MAGTATYTERDYGTVKLLKCAWVSDASGDVSGTASSIVYDGKLLAVTTDPSATAPTDDYDVTVLDDNSMDVLLGAGSDRDTANTEYLLEANLGAVAKSKLTVTVANAGNAKEGTVYIWIR